MANRLANQSALQSLTIEVAVPGQYGTQPPARFISESDDLLDKSKQRNLLIYDEVVPVVVVIRGPGTSDELDELLRHAELTIVAHVSSTGQPPDEQDGRVIDTAKHVLDTKVFGSGINVEDIFTSEDGTKVSAALCTELHLRHPEKQLYRPAVQFTTSMSLPASSDDDITHAASEYMTSGVPMPENLLQGLQNSPAFAGSNVHLSATRIQKVVPRSRTARPETRPIKGNSRQIAIVPAVAARIARSVIGGQLLISLEIEIIKWAKCSVVLEDVSGERQRQQIATLPLDLKLPQIMGVVDKTNCVFRLDGGSAESTQLRIEAKALLSETCRPHISIRRTVGPSPHVPRRSHVSISRHWQRPTSQVSRPTSMTIPDKGMTFSISAPSQVIVGETFGLDILVVNRSFKKRRLAILAVTESHKTDHATKRSSKMTSRMDMQESSSIAQSVVDEQALYRSQSNKAGHATRAVVLSVTTDVKVGPLASGACHDAQLEFLTLSPGVVAIDALTIVDLDTRETVYVTELPDIVATDRSELENDL